MTRPIITCLIALFSSLTNFAQYLTQGNIAFTRSTNAKLNFQLEADDEFKNSTYYKEILKKMPKNITDHFMMSFNESRSVYFFEKEGTEKSPFQWGGKDPASENIVIKDLVKKTFTAQKEIYDDTYIISDTIREFQWKIHDEVRDIAGYPCRKATTMINDSVVVVAYYTERIMVSSGPESFGGLPGMILGLAIPRLYTSWFATKVESVELPDEANKKFKKGKAVNYDKLYADLQKRLKDWGNYGSAILWKVNL